jgi:hypothetical protein
VGVLEKNGKNLKKKLFPKDKNLKIGKNLGCRGGKYGCTFTIFHFHFLEFNYPCLKRKLKKNSDFPTCKSLIEKKI